MKQDSLGKTFSLRAGGAKQYFVILTKTRESLISKHGAHV